MSLLSFLFIFFLFVCPSVPPFVYLVCTFLLFALCVSLNFLFLPLASSVSSPLSYICYDLFFPIFSALSLSLFLYLLSSFDPSFFPPIAAVLTLAFNWTSIDVIPPPKKKIYISFTLILQFQKSLLAGKKRREIFVRKARNTNFCPFFTNTFVFVVVCFFVSSYLKQDDLHEWVPVPVKIIHCKGEREKGILFPLRIMLERLVLPVFMRA